MLAERPTRQQKLLIGRLQSGSLIETVESVETVSTVDRFLSQVTTRSGRTVLLGDVVRGKFLDFSFLFQRNVILADTENCVTFTILIMELGLI